MGVCVYKGVYVDKVYGCRGLGETLRSTNLSNSSNGIRIMLAMLAV